MKKDDECTMRACVFDIEEVGSHDTDTVMDTGSCEDKPPMSTAIGFDIGGEFLLYFGWCKVLLDG